MKIFRMKACKTFVDRVLCSNTEERLNSEFKKNKRFSAAFSKGLSFALAAAMMIQNFGFVPVSAEEKEPNQKIQSVSAIADPDTVLSTSPDEIGKVLTQKNVTASGDSLDVALSALSSTSDETTQVPVPLEIVLVLDVSGSMAFDFNGNRNPVPGQSRLEGLKTAVGQFLDKVEARNAEITDPSKLIQIGLVDYASSSTGRSLSSNITAVRNALNGFQANGATRTDRGMNTAEYLLQKKRDGSRQAVIFFTDGVPTTHSAFDNTVATTTVETAGRMKSDGVSIYSVGIFTGANPTVNPNSVSSDSRNETSKANRFMQMVSSNCPTATSFTQSPVDYTPNGYYLSAANASGLDSVFNQIFQDVTTQAPNPVAESTSVVFRDQLGAGMEVSSIRSLEYNGTVYSNPTVTENGNTLSYTFNAEVAGNVLSTERANLSSVTITVTRGEEMAGDVIEFSVPSNLLPLVKYHRDGTDDLKVQIPAVPVTLTYTASPKAALKSIFSGNTDGATEAASQFIAENADENGNLYLLSNAYESGENGTTTASFTPNAANAFYYEMDGSQKPAPAASVKSSNPTVTATNEISSAWNGSDMIASLGNNGKLTYSDVLGSLTVAKRVTVPEGFTVDEDKEFSFTINANYPDGTPLSGTYSDLVFTDGQATFTLKNGEKKTIGRLPLLGSYTVTEAPAEGYTTTVNQGTTPSNLVSGTVETDSRADFLNAYSASEITLEPTDSLLQGVKALSGRDWLDSDSFEFAVEALNGAPEPENTSATVSGSDDSKAFDFGKVTFDKPGTYVYQVTEKTSEVPGVTADGTVYTVTITVTDNGNGSLSAVSRISENSEDADQIEFTNTFAADETGFTPTFIKQLTSEQGTPNLNSEDYNGKFSFTLRPAEGMDASIPMPEGSENGVATAVNNGSVIAFGQITYQASDVGKTYRYSVRETAGDLPGVSYSDQEYILEVVVGSEEIDGRQAVALTVTTYKDGTPLDDYITEAVFENTLKLQPVTLNTDTGIRVIKNMTGKEIDDQEFSFQIAPADGTEEAVEDGRVVLPEETSISVPVADLVNGTASSSAVFEGITFNHEGTYRFSITENVPEGAFEGIEYDTTTHYVTVEVTRTPGTDQLSAEVVYDLPGSDAVRFNNSYSAQPTEPVSVSAVKNVTAAEGFTAPDATYTFVLTSASGLATTIYSSAGSFNVLNGLTFNEPGTYVYTLHEEPVTTLENGTAIPDSAMTYDQSVYQITVTVTDDKLGKLIADLSIEKKENADSDFEPVETEDGIVFTNHYAPVSVTTDTSLTPAASKILEGRDQNLQAGEFTFDVALKGNPEDGAVYNGEDTATNDENGSLNLGTITFSKPGTYTFSVKERENPDQSHIDFDTATREWVYTVEDRNGQLVIAELTEPENPIFTNSYHAEGSFAFTSLPVTKIFTGRPDNAWLSSDSFEFTLEAADETTEQAVSDGDIVLPETTITATADDKSPTFGSIEFKKAGSYHFRVSETAGNIASVTYDSTVYDVVITVTDNNDGTLSAKLTSGPENSDFAFTNTYSADSVTLDTEAEFGITKVFEGKKWNDETFRFLLTQTQGDEQAVTVNASELTLSADQPSGSFGTILFNAPGTYVFEIAEAAGEQPAEGEVEYDSHKVVITVEVTDDSNGKLVAEVTSNTGDHTFTNAFTPNETSAVINGLKKIEGREWLDTDSFAFELLDSEGNVIQTRTANKANPAFAFEAIDFASTGTYEYTIREIAGEAGNGIQYDDSEQKVTVEVTQNDDGSLSAAVQYPDGAEAVQFTNIYSASPVTGLTDLDAQKNVASENADFAMSAGQFLFTVTADENNPESDPYAGTREVSNDANGHVDLFEDGEFSVPGTYRYTVSERDNQIPGMSYDGTSYLITVIVTDNQSGNLEKTVTINNGSTDVDSIVFNNTYNPEKASALIQVLKQLEGKELTSGMFGFTLTYQGMDEVEDPNAPAEDTEENPGLTPDTDDTTQTPVDSEPASPSEPAQPENPGEPADAETPAGSDDASAGNEAADDSASEPGTAEAAEPNSENETPAETAEPAVLTNELAEPEPETADADVLPQTETETPADQTSEPAADGQNDEIAGEEANEDESGDEETEPAESEIPAVLKARNVGSTVSFDSIEFTKPGDYHFVITEDNEGLPGVTYDESEKYVTVQVRHDQTNGRLVVTAIDGAGAELQTFVNSYRPNPVTVSGEGSVTATKVLEGRNLKDGEFSFELLDNNGAVAATGVNNADGTVVFEPIGDALTFTETGTYAFVMREVAGEAGGVTYDERTYGVLITVTDDNAQLVAEVSIQDESGTAVFTNRYEAKPAVYAPSVTKTLEGEELKEGQFEFTLSQDGKVLQTVKNSADGTVSFEELAFDEPGVYVYQIAEKADDTDHYIYDEKVLTLTVTVEDDGDGNLVSTGEYDSEAEFVNKAKEKPAVPIPGKPEAPATKPSAPTAIKTGLGLSLSTAALSLAGIITILRKRREEK